VADPSKVNAIHHLANHGVMRAAPTRPPTPGPHLQVPILVAYDDGQENGDGDGYGAFAARAKRLQLQLQLQR